MTLHFAAVSHSGAVVSVGDRLLTTGVAGSAKPWDRLANKTLVVSGSGFNIVVSYSGLAHIDGQPTDEWLSTLITGMPVAPGLSSRLSMRIGALEQPLSLPEIVGRIKVGLETDLQRQTPPNRWLGVLIAGRSYQRRARFGLGRIRPICLRMTNDGRRGSATTVDMASRDAWPPGCLVLCSVGVDANPVRSRVAEYLQSASDYSLIDLEGRIVDALRDLAATPTGDQVGDQCMSVILWHDKIEIRFHRTAENPPGTAYTPFVISNAAIFPPLVINGRGRLNLGGIDVAVVPPYGSAGVASVSRAASQPRKGYVS
ncbi:hypothetical protein [Cellulomonas sp. A375-1]|uniref:hypothetical protein n=1 Tax=Cellulomonas sp. A375-1 TaxID=1672219 RepID=UPI0012E24FD6|nr:hypothetical protein [Cellulomonas sp. A375-1]